MSYDTLVLGGGLAGLSCAHRLTGAGKEVAVLEREGQVGGLSRTIVSGEFKFDLGGHRFFTKKKELNDYVEALLGPELVEVGRSSKIYLRGRYFDYPLRPGNAFFGMGVKSTVEILAGYLKENVRKRTTPREVVSLEDWVVENFGRGLFELFFKDYSEKVWGLSCSEISRDWVAQRIKGLSLGRAVKDALSRDGEEVATLIKKFTYPRGGIGRLPQVMRERIEERNQVFTNLTVDRINLEGKSVASVRAKNCDSYLEFEAENFVSSLPLNQLVKMISPSPPREVLQAAERLRFRDTIVVALFVDRERVTRESWIYFPGKDIPFGRLHETRNWSDELAPEGKTCLVVEYFCFREDELCRKDDSELVGMTAHKLEELGYIEGEDLIGGKVVRVNNAYPLFKIGYREDFRVISDYLEKIENLQTAGRSGRFEYFNIDAAIESGLKVAGNLLGEDNSLSILDDSYLEEIRQ